MAELYDLRHDPDEDKNLIADPKSAATLEQLKAELTRLMEATGLSPANDKMPLDAGIKKELPDQRIR